MLFSFRYVLVDGLFLRLVEIKEHLYGRSMVRLIGPRHHTYPSTKKLYRLNRCRLTYKTKQAHLKFVDQQTNEVHKVNQFRRLEMLQQVTH